MTSQLLTGDEAAVYGDSGYLGADKRDDAVIKNKSCIWCYKRAIPISKDTVPRPAKADRKTEYAVNLILADRPCLAV